MWDPGQGCVMELPLGLIVGFDEKTGTIRQWSLSIQKLNTCLYYYSVFALVLSWWCCGVSIERFNGYVALVLIYLVWVLADSSLWVRKISQPWSYRRSLHIPTQPRTATILTLYYFLARSIHSAVVHIASDILITLCTPPRKGNWPPSLPATMSRSAADATRFTATGPYASSKTSIVNTGTSKWTGAKSSTSKTAGPFASPEGSKQETPKQKVERLRAEARAARYSKAFTPMDRIMSKGRIWADRAHKITVYTLITASGTVHFLCPWSANLPVPKLYRDFTRIGIWEIEFIILDSLLSFRCFLFLGIVLTRWFILWNLGIAAALTIYSATSLIIYNRRQRQLWIDKELQKLLDARKAYVAGNPTPDQLLLLEKEKQAEEEKRLNEELKKQTMFYKGKAWLFGGLKNEDSPSAGFKGADEIADSRPSVLEAVNANRVENAAPFERAPNPGGQLEPKTHEGSNESKRSWTSWITGR